MSAAGVRYLDALFGISQAEKINAVRRGCYLTPRGAFTVGVTDTRPVRLRPGCPVLRDVEHQARHRKRKAAKAARKRNR